MTWVWSMFGSRELQVLHSFLTLKNTWWRTVLFLLASWITTAGYHLLSNATVTTNITSRGNLLRNTAQTCQLCLEVLYRNPEPQKRKRKKNLLRERTHHQDQGQMESLVLLMVGQRKKKRQRWGRPKKSSNFIDLFQSVTALVVSNSAYLAEQI